MTDLFSQIRRLLLYIGDIGLLYGTLLVVLVFRYGDEYTAHTWQTHLWPFTTIFAIWIAVFYISGLYDSRGYSRGIDLYTQILRVMLANAIIGIVYFYIFSNRYFSIKPQVVLLVFVGVFTVLFLLWRRSYNLLAHSQALSRNVLFIGSGRDMDTLMAELTHRSQLGYRVAQHISSDSPELTQLNFAQRLREQNIDTVVTAPEIYQMPDVVAQFYQNLFLGVRFYDLPTFYEKISGKVPVSTIGQLWFLENISENEKKFYEIAKRVMEIVITLAVGTIGLILSPFIALAIKISTPGPILFKQSRVGKAGQVFRAMKFRSMVEGAEKNGAQWAKINDPRVTRVGKFLRATRLDEIPQLVNVLRGEMSFIGPRPERPEFVQELTKKIPFYGERHLIKPGLTGWAQVNFPYGASEEDAMEKLQYDLYYIKNRSILLDMGIILKTINTIISHQGR